MTMVILKIVLSLGLFIFFIAKLDAAGDGIAAALAAPKLRLGIGLAFFALCVQSALAALRQVDLLALFGHRLSLIQFCLLSVILKPMQVYFQYMSNYAFCIAQ